MQHETHPVHSPTAAPTAQPVAGPHPEDVDPLGRAHAQQQLAPEERRVVSLLVVALIAFIVCVPIIAVVSESPVLNVLLGLTPLLLSIIIDLSLAARHYKVLTFWIVLLAVHVLFIGIFWLLNLVLYDQINIAGSITTSVIFAIIVTIIVMLADAKRVKEAVNDQVKHDVPFKAEKIDEYVHAIEDKIKALNFAIGRVYRASNGGTMKMRERLRVPSEWYNEFNTFRGEDVDTQLDQAAVLLRKIRDRLGLYTQKEKDVFHTSELSSLKHLARQKDGEDRIIDVLKTNDRDPVEHYYVSAIDFCDRILAEIEEKV